MNRLSSQTDLQNTCLILDFGGVISKTLFETHAITEQALGLPANTLEWQGPFDPDSDSLWSAMQRDEISERDYWLTRSKEVGELVGERWTEMSQFVKAARGAEPDKIIRPEAVATIKQVKQRGGQLAILSNELDLFYGAELREKLDIINDFDVIVDATYTEILKPDLRAYQAVHEKLSIKAECCVFVDDQLRNIVGAQQYGFGTVHFDVMNPSDSYQQALSLLETAAST